MSTLRVSSFAIALLAACPAAHGSMLFESDPGLNGLGVYQGDLAFSYEGSGTGLLTISLTNTSPAANGGRLTGFAFNTIAGLTLTLASGLNNWDGMTNVDASPFPNFDFGAAIGGDFLGGGSPNSGIGVGATAVFTFSVAGADALLASIDESAFLDASGGYGFIARFRGFADGGSDKVTAQAVQGVPAPGALALLGLAGVAARRQR